jgi:hypothetical protein
MVHLVHLLRNAVVFWQVQSNRNSQECASILDAFTFKLKEENIRIRVSQKLVGSA